MAGKKEDEELIKAKTPALLEKYISYVDILEPFLKEHFKEEDSDGVEKKKMEPSVLKEKIIQLKEAAENLDSDTEEQLISELSSCSLSPDEEKFLIKLKDAVDNFDSDTVTVVTDQWKSFLEAQI